MTEVVPVPNHFTYDLKQVKELIERKDTALLEQMGGLAGVMSSLEVNAERGIKSGTVDNRRDQWGWNKLDEKPPVTFLEFLKEAFEDQIVQLLCVAAVISILFGMLLPNPHTGHVERESGWIEGTAIIISVAAVTLTGAINNYQKAKKFEEMAAIQKQKTVSVIRDGLELTIDSTELTMGDIMLLESGVELTCDGLFISGADLKTNESAMTGESDIIKKTMDGDCFFLSGTLLEEGAGKMLVIATGMHSFQGSMKESIDNDQDSETPLQEHLGTLADNIGKGGLVGAIVLVVALSLKEVILISTNEREANASMFLNFVIIAITLIVVAIPEGLPLAVTISLAYSMKAMMADNCLVRILASCETMGAATAICSDKTGTLTTNIMTVVQGLMNEEEFVIQGYALHERNDTVNKVNRESMTLRSSETNKERFCYAMAINSTAREQEVDGTVMWLGNKTEHGLLGFVKLCGYDYKEMRASVTEDCKRQFPFNSKKKRMTTIVKDNSGLLTAYCKGASEVILDDCDRYMDVDGSIVDFTPVKRQMFQDVINDMAHNGNRTIGISLCPCHFTEFPEEEPNLSMVFLGVMGIQDPIREAVPQAVLNCHSAGLVVRMVTGDNINTAIAISKKCNIFHENGWDMAMTGKELRELFDEAQSNAESKARLMDIVPRLRILARSSPSDKHILVGLLQEIGEVVGVTGDGTNDAPALSLADVGFAMNTGTDIAKSAADMVLIDDNFASVVNAIRWGRAVNDNIRKFLQFQLSINVAGVGLTIIGSLASHSSKEPFTAVQLLWLNLIMDTLAAMALATELPDESSLKREPVYKQAPLISNKMWAFIGVHAGFQTALILAILFRGHVWFNTIESKGRCDKTWTPEAYPVLTNVTVTDGSVNSTTEVNVTHYREGPEQTWCRDACEDDGGQLNSNQQCQQGLVHSTIIFNIFIFMQIFNIFNARKLYQEINPFEGMYPRSTMLMKVFFIILAFQVIAIEVLGPMMKTTNLKWDHWLICVGLGLLELPLGFIPRLLPVKNTIPEMIIEKTEKEKALRTEVSKGTHKGSMFHRSDSSLRRTNSLVNKQASS